MVLEKIKNNSGKIAVFFINLLVVGLGVLQIRNTQLEKDLKQKNQELLSRIDQIEQTQLSSAEVAAAQAQLATERQAKTNAIASNPAEVTKPVTKQVTQVIPGKTTTVTVPVTSSTATSSKTTTKKS